MRYLFKVTQTSMNQTARDWARNITNIYKAIDEAVVNGSDLLALEELALTGYDVGDDFELTDNDFILGLLKDIAAYAAQKDPDLILSVGHPWRLQLRDVQGPLGAAWERVNNPLYDRHNRPFNVQSFIMNGKILGMTAKSALYVDGRGYENRYFNQWSVAAANYHGGVFGTINIDIDGNIIPFGRPFIHAQNKDGAAFILTHVICEEKWVASQYDSAPHDYSRYETDNIIPYLSKFLGSKEGLIIVNPNASPPSPNKIIMHEDLDKTASHYAALVVDTDGMGSSGSTFSQFGNRLIAQNGKIISFGSRIRFDRLVSTHSVTEISSANASAAAKCHVSFVRKKSSDTGPLPQQGVYKLDDLSSWDVPENVHRVTEESIRNIALWCFDYMRKSGQRGIANASSGGADSTCNAVLMGPVMIGLVVAEKGARFFCDELRLPYADQAAHVEAEKGKEKAVRFIMNRFMINIYMGTVNSSKNTFNAAQLLVEGGQDLETGDMYDGIGGKFIYRNVQDLIDFYALTYAVEDSTLLSDERRSEILTAAGSYLRINHFEMPADEIRAKAQALKDTYPEIVDLLTNMDGTAVENVQARARTVLLNVFANKYGFMPIANPNLDEACNGYTTFAGDMHAGPINPNGHLGKARQKDELMPYLALNGLSGAIAPIRSMLPVLRLTPSAELLPDDKGKPQTDEDSLQRSFRQMRRLSVEQLYERLDTAHGARRKNPSEVYQSVKTDALFADTSSDVLFNMVVKTYERWNVAQWKIHAGPIQMADGHNIDHQVSRRTPNFSGGSWGEICTLALNVARETAEVSWSDHDHTRLLRLAIQDERFIKDLRSKIRVKNPGQDYSILSLCADINRYGIYGVFPILSQVHPFDASLGAR
jgi:NH3-dependent NAD+ synthetase/predicted amidohydrolase